MTEPATHPVLEDPPQPDLAEYQQREVFDLPTVPVRLDGPAAVTRLPNRKFTTVTEALGAAPARILYNDPSRARAVVVMYSATATDNWVCMSSSSGQSVVIPANVPIVFEHCDEVWAKVGVGFLSLAVMIENWAD